MVEKLNDYLVRKVDKKKIGKKKALKKNEQ
jgi:hypothetical protein